MKVDDRTYFTLKRLHSLTGVVPIGLFLVEHLYTNSRALQGPAAFDTAAADLARMPFVVLIEALGIWLPILFHMVLGILISTTGQSTIGRHGYARNWQYTLQRASGILLVFYLLYHTWALRFDRHYLHSASAYEYVSHHLAHPAVLAFYLLGTVAACYHFGNGLFGFAIHWGLATSRAGQRRIAAAGLAVFIALSLLGVGALFGFRGLRVNLFQKPHGLEHGAVVLRGEAR